MYSWSGIFPNEDSSLDESGFFHSIVNKWLEMMPLTLQKNANIVYMCTTHMYSENVMKYMVQ